MASDLVNLADLADRINVAHEEAFSHARAAILRAADVGELLAQAKAQVKHGGWIPWVEANCRFGVRQAQKYLRAHENRGAIEANANPDSHLTIDEALALIAEPAPRRFPEMEAHPECGMVPDMTPEEYRGLCDSIAKHGLGSAIVVYKGKILDGRQRYRACREMGVPPRFEEYVPGPQEAGRSEAEIITGYIMAVNVARSSYSAEQRVDIHAKLAGYQSKEAAGAVAAGGRKALTKDQAQRLMDEAKARLGEAEECWSKAKATLTAIRSGLQGDDLAAYLATFESGMRGALLWASDNPEASFMAAIKRYPGVFGWKAEHLDMLEPFA